MVHCMHIMYIICVDVMCDVMAVGVLCSLMESPHPPPPPSIVLNVKECLINCRQHEAFIRTLMVYILKVKTMRTINII